MCVSHTVIAYHRFYPPNAKAIYIDDMLEKVALKKETKVSEMQLI